MIFAVYINNNIILCGDFIYNLKGNREGFNKFKIIGVEYGSEYDKILDELDGDFDIILKDFINDYGNNVQYNKIELIDAFITDKIIRLRDNVIDYCGEFEIINEE